MMNCTICAKDVQPVLDLAESGRVLSLCPTCKTPLGSGMSATDQPEPAPIDRGAAGTPNGTIVKLRPAEPQDLVAAAKARLQVINTELDRLGALQREHRRLTAMIAAAESSDIEDNLALSVRRSLVAPLPLTNAAE